MLVIPAIVPFESLGVVFYSSSIVLAVSLTIYEIVSGKE